VTQDHTFCGPSDSGLRIADCDSLRLTIISLVEVHVTRCLLRLDLVIWCAALGTSASLYRSNSELLTERSHWPALNVMRGWIDMVADMGRCVRSN
jgi:hypothetical protein